MHFRTVQQFSPGSFLKAPRNHVVVLLQFLTPKRSVEGEFFMKRRHKPLSGSFWNVEISHQCCRSILKLVIFDFYTFEEMRRVKKWKERERRTMRLMERTESRETARMPDQMGMWEGKACFVPAQRWGSTKRVVHQIFIWASVHSLELHYGTKAAENILEEQLNKNVAYL